MIPNTSVTFQNPATGLKVTYPAQLYRARGNPRLDPYSAQFDWGVCLPPGLAYHDGVLVSTEHHIIWSGLGMNSDGTSRKATLKHVLLNLGSPPSATLFFNEQS